MSGLVSAFGRALGEIARSLREYEAAARSANPAFYVPPGGAARSPSRTLRNAPSAATNGAASGPVPADESPRTISVPSSGSASQGVSIAQTFADRERLIAAVVMSEILAAPVSLR